MTTNAAISNIDTSNTNDNIKSSLQETCLICGDVASGKHYGLRSCEACKAFFKRTVQGKIEYSCPATRECEINKRRRKACQACRFQKCLNMGMLKEGVRLDRVRGGRQKYKRGLSPSSIGTSSAGPASGGSGGSSDNHNDILAIARNGQQSNSNCKSSQVKVLSLPSSETDKIMTALNNCEPEELTASPAQFATNLPSTLSVQMKTLYILSDLFDRELVSLIGWAKQIPGFSENITLNDQMRLLQSTWAEVIALSIGYRSHLKRLENQRQQYHRGHGGSGGGGAGGGGSGGGSGSGCTGSTVNHVFSNTTPSPTSSSSSASTTSSYNFNGNPYDLDNVGVKLVFAKDLIIDFKHAVTCGADEIFYSCAQLIERLDFLKITRREYILLKAISLTNADVRLENPRATHQLRDLIMETLYEVTIFEQHRFNQVLLCLPVLRQIDWCIRKFWNDVRKGPNNVPMNKLFEEMLEPCRN